jgi:hypothetical protein
MPSPPRLEYCNDNDGAMPARPAGTSIGIEYSNAPDGDTFHEPGIVPVDDWTPAIAGNELHDAGIPGGLPAAIATAPCTDGSTPMSEAINAATVETITNLLSLRATAGTLRRPVARDSGDSMNGSS